MDKTIVVRWQDWSATGTEHAVVRIEDSSSSIDSIVLSANGAAPFAVRYRLQCDASWALRRAKIELVGADRELHLIGDGRGQYRDGEGSRLTHLDGAIDIDLSVTPFTNTLPIRRLNLKKGQSRDIVTAYVHFPDLAISADPQRYTCLEPMKLYRYESLDSDFVREIEVDENGLVVTYPGLFRRLM